MRKAMPVLALALAAIATTQWPDGTTSQDPATTLESCFTAARAWLGGRALPLNAPGIPLSVKCHEVEPGQAGFKPGWDCIQGFNCKEEGR